MNQNIKRFFSLVLFFTGFFYVVITTPEKTSGHFQLFSDIVVVILHM